MSKLRRFLETRERELLEQIYPLHAQLQQKQVELAEIRLAQGKPKVGKPRRSRTSAKV